MTGAPGLAALAVVLRAGRVLLVRRSNPPDAGLWGFPGGRVRLGEPVADAAARELREETGVSAAPRKVLESVEVIRRDPDGAVRFHFVLVPVLCDFVEGEPAPADDVHEAAWTPVEAALDRRLPMSADVDDVLGRALDRAAERRP